MPSKTEPWTFLNSINNTKINLEDDPDVIIDDYVPFVVNRSLSYFVDTVLHANEMNLCKEASNSMQYQFLLNSVKPRKRFAKWVKPVKSEDVKLIQDVYNCNVRRAAQYLDLLTQQELEIIKTKTDTGGIGDKFNRDIR